MATNKRTGLGRGIGSLIPTAPTTERPVDVFFPDQVGTGAIPVVENNDANLIEVPGARLAFIYTRRGISNESCSSFFLPRAVGMQRAMEWVMTGRMVLADELKESGFVRDVVPPAELLPRARAIAREIADNTSPVAVAISRKLMWNMLTATHPLEASRLECRGLTAVMNLPDAKEGPAAFVEKRPAKFTTRPSKDLGFMRNWFAKP